jgi:hypothetical protein
MGLTPTFLDWMGGLDLDGLILHFENDPVEASFEGLLHHQEVLPVSKGCVNVLIATQRAENLLNEPSGLHFGMPSENVMCIAMLITRVVPDELHEPSTLNVTL